MRFLTITNGDKTIYLNEKDLSFLELRELPGDNYKLKVRYKNLEINGYIDGNQFIGIRDFFYDWNDNVIIFYKHVLSEIEMLNTEKTKKSPFEL